MDDSYMRKGDDSDWERWHWLHGLNWSHFLYLALFLAIVIIYNKPGCTLARGSRHECFCPLLPTFHNFKHPFPLTFRSSCFLPQHPVHWNHLNSTYKQTRPRVYLSCLLLIMLSPMPQSLFSGFHPLQCVWNCSPHREPCLGSFKFIRKIYFYPVWIHHHRISHLVLSLFFHPCLRRIPWRHEAKCWHPLLKYLPNIIGKTSR